MGTPGKQHKEETLPSILSLLSQGARRKACGGWEGV